MQPGEVVNLSWSQTDFIAGVLHLPDRDVPMGNRMRRLLKETWERQKDLPTDKVFVAPTTGNPMDQSRLSVVSRTAMIRADWKVSACVLFLLGPMRSGWMTS